ncbi:hypothetical protein MUP59_02050 [Candidatus Bathyarchaeota archaeon]|nr:hypothetical protein [Candidatus Bathyarchaeota archaeon]
MAEQRLALPAGMPAFKGKKAPKQGNLVINQGLSIIVQTRSPWYTKKRQYMRLLPPWSMLRGYLVEIAKRPAMLAAAEAFKRVAEATAGINREQRRQIIRGSLRGKSYGGRPRKPMGRLLAPSEVDSLIARLR